MQGGGAITRQPAGRDPSRRVQFLWISRADFRLVSPNQRRVANMSSTAYPTAAEPVHVDLR